MSGDDRVGMTQSRERRHRWLDHVGMFWHGRKEGKVVVVVVVRSGDGIHMGAG